MAADDIYIEIDMLLGHRELQERLVPHPGGWLACEYRSLDYDQCGRLLAATDWSETGRMRFV